jgi:hypothetical protein
MMVVVTMRSRPDADGNAGAVMVVMMVSDHDPGGRVLPLCARRWSSAFSSGRAFGIGSKRSR